MKLLTLLLFFGVSAFQLCFANFYVSPTGNNADDGTIDHPWQTVQFGIDHLFAGDTLFIMDGVYHEKLSWTQGGAPGFYMTVMAFGSGAIIDGTGAGSANALIAISNQSYIRIQGLELRNNIQNDAQGIAVNGNAQGIELISNVIHDIHFSANPNDVADENHNAQGIIVLGDNPATAISDLVIFGNSLYNCRLGYSEGIAVNGNVDGFHILSNTVHDLTNIGIVAIGHEQTSSDPATDQARNGMIFNNTCYNCNSPYAYCGGIYIDGAKSVQILSNFCYSNDYGIEIGCEHPGKTASDITARNNILVNNKSCGLAFGGYDYPANSGSVINSSFYSNTLAKNDVSNEGSGEITMNYTESCIVNNNVLFPSMQGIAVSFAATSLNPAFDYNLYYTEASDLSGLIATDANSYTLSQYQATGQEAHGLFGNPNFASALLDIFSYSGTTSSAGYNNGNPAYPALTAETDFFGNQRIAGGTVDRGASEYDGGLGLTQNASTVLHTWPNPAIETLNFTAQHGNALVIDLHGKMILQSKADSGKIDVRALPAGAYVLVLPTGSAKFVKP